MAEFLAPSASLLMMASEGTGSGSDLEVFQLLMGLVGGLALFLFGMEQMASSLKSAAGERMKTILSRLTSNRFMGVCTGAFVTAVIQSSSVTTVLVVGFITAGLMTLAQSIGIIMGANIGTTITAQVIAFKVTKYALLMIAIGFAMMFLAKKQRIKSYGSGIMGLGLVFFGMAVMGDAMTPLRTFPPFLDMMARMDNPLLGILAGAGFTALVQSSSATTGVVIVMATQGFISLPAGIALSFGANIGTCVTALLAAIGRPREALRASVVHIAFNVIGVMVWIPFIDQLAHLVTSFSPVAADMEGTAKLGAETPRQIANAHTIFNVANTFIFIWFTTQFARLVEYLLPDRPVHTNGAAKPKYLDESLISTPSLAIERARLEILHMGDSVKEMLQRILPAMLTGSHEALTAVEIMDDAADALHGHIITYLGQISHRQLTDKETADLLRLMAAANDLENIGDLIETNLVALGRQRLQDHVTISEPTRHVIGEFHAAVARALDGSLLAVTQKDAEAAQVVVEMKGTINRLEGSAALHEARRLVASEPNRLSAYTVEIDMISNLKRIYYFCKRLARSELESREAASPETV